MHTEYNALMRNNTWTLVSLLADARIVACRWVYKTKYIQDGSLDRFKAHLVAQGFTQTPRVDYFDTFIQIVKPCTIRLILTLTISFG